MHFGGARGSQDRPGYPRGRSCARPAPTPRQRPRPSGPSGKHPPHRGGGKSRLSYPEARSLELDGSRRGPFCRARALLQGVKRARCPCPGAGGRRRCRTHAGALLTAARPSACRATASGVRLPRPLGSYGTAASGGRSHGRMALHPCCLSAAARSVGPAKSRGPAAAQAGVRWTRLTRRRPSPAAPLLRCVPAAPPGAETAAMAAIV